MLEVLFRDTHYVAINKPSGLLVHRTRLALERQCAMTQLRDQLGSWVYPVHRLDRATSGVLLFALSPEAAELISREFRERKVFKSYLAVTRGYTPEQGEIDRPVRSSPQKPYSEAFSSYIQLARAEIQAPVGRYPTARYSLVRVTPSTGRLHQIRKHLASISHPIVGDTVYGDGKHNRFFRERFGMHRLLLFADALVFEHPFSKIKTAIHAPLPADVVHLCEQLGWRVDQLSKIPD